MKQYALNLWGFVARNERILAPLFLIGGLLWNSITLRRVDLLPETIVLYVHLILAALLIVLEHLNESRPALPEWFKKAASLFPLALSFIFGSLFSIFSVFYVKSASLADSWPFIFVFFAVIIGIEFSKRYRTRFVFNLSLYFFALISFCIFATPLWAGKIGTDIFVDSVLIALALFALLLFVLSRIGKERLRQNFIGIALGAACIAFAIGLLYITNTIPPIPLSLKDIGVYHTLVKQGNDYRLGGETKESLASFVEKTLFDETIHLAPNESLYVFSAVFTPVVIRTNIIHRWEYWDTTHHDWVSKEVFSFPIGGGRQEGYRGFSQKNDLTPGRWRVSVETPDGLKIGRVTFNIVSVALPTTLVETIR